MIMAKARVAPIKKKWSFHRYELMACLLGAKVTANIVANFKLKIADQFFWVDNMACVSWIHKDPEKYQAFVANRIREIQAISNPTS